MPKSSKFVFKKSFLFLCAVLLLGLAGCDEDTVTPASEIPPIGPVHGSPELAWGGIQWSFDNDNPEGWEVVISEDFTYSPDSVSAQKYPTAFVSWDNASEVSFVRILFSSGLEFEATMFPIGYDPPSASSPEITWESIEYAVKVTNVVDNSSIVYQGIANIEFRLEGALWYLYRWEDLSGSIVPWDPEVVLPTLGELRGTLGSVK